MSDEYLTIPIRGDRLGYIPQGQGCEVRSINGQSQSSRMLKRSPHFTALPRQGLDPSHMSKISPSILRGITTFSI
jgi:hypothetical protein